MSNRSRLKPSIIIVSVVLVVGVVATSLFIGKVQARKEFLGKVNGAGYRCRFTLSPNWKQGKKEIHVAAPITEYETFGLTPSPIRDWIDKHILRRTPAQPLPIVLIGGSFMEESSSWRMVDGYPEPGPQMRIPITKHRHQIIDGCPATVLSWERTSGGVVRRSTILLISTRDQSAFYEVIGRTGTPITDRSDPVDREMEAIIASFHIEKVTGGKQ